MNNGDMPASPVSSAAGYQAVGLTKRELFAAMAECLLFSGAISSTGYGAKWRNGRMVGAHRVAYEDSFGPIPNGLMVLHSCDNKACVNPYHLRVGSAAENARDAVDLGLIARGMRHGRNTRPESRKRGPENGMSVMTLEDARRAVRMRRDGAKLKDIGRALGVSISFASRVCRGDTYADALLAALEKQP